LKKDFFYVPGNLTPVAFFLHLNLMFPSRTPEPEIRCFFLVTDSLMLLLSRTSQPYIRCCFSRT
jgi:hypothetical protein